MLLAQNIDRLKESMDVPKPVAEIMAVEVLPRIFVGDSRAANSSSFFKQAQISGVLNMTASIPNKFRCDDKIEYLRVPVYDCKMKRDVNQMRQYFLLVTEFIHKITVLEQRNILVHCALGRQRSCAAVAAYLIRYHDMAPLEAMRFIVARKPDAFHWGKSANFGPALNMWYTDRSE